MIRLENVCKRYHGGHDALDDISLDIATGELVLVTGHSGAGKSTLLKLLAAIERPTSGSIWFNEQNISRIRRSSLPWLRRNFGLVFQDRKLLMDRDVLHNVLLPLDIAGTPRHDAFVQSRAALDQVGLGAFERTKPAALSAGEQQLVCIARAIATRPPLLLLDEPTSNLDADAATAILKQLLAFNRHGTTVIVSSHDPATHRALPGRMITLAHGKMTP